MAAELPSSMRASQWSSTAGGIEKNLKLNSSAALPKNAKSLPAGATLVKVSYATINPVDYKIAEAPIVNNFISGIPGFDYSGKVAATTVPHLKPGDPVFGLSDVPACGTLGEYVIIASEKGVAPVPNGLPLDQAACIGVAGQTAYQAIAPFVKSGDKVFINGGSGGVGTFGIQIAKALGCHVTTSCSGPNVDFCKSLGADQVIDYRTQNVVETLKRSGTQYDLLCDFVFTNPDIYWSAHHYLKPEGKFVDIAASPSLHSIIDLLKVYLWPSALGGGQRKFQLVTCTASVEDLGQVAKLISEGKVKAIIEKTYELEDAAKAFERLKSSRTRGKLVIKVSA